jgi:hypothetical protein
LQGALGAACAAIFSFVEKRRQVSFVLELVARRHELASLGYQQNGVLLRLETELRWFPIQASFLVVAVTTGTCPAAEPRPAAKAVAVAINALLGWWSWAGLLRTPVCLWSCFKGGKVTTVRQLLEKVVGAEQSRAA